jgi:hypothetical protein
MILYFFFLPGSVPPPVTAIPRRRFPHAGRAVSEIPD